VFLETPYLWRDVHGAVLQVSPVSVDHRLGTMKILKGGTIKLTSTELGVPMQKKVADKDFYGVYATVYSNFDYFSDKLVASDSIGRTLVVHESQYKSHAEDYADFVMEQWSQEAILLEATGSSDAIQSAIKTHYEEDAGLSFVVIVGRNVPTLNGPETRAECDNCYAMINGDTIGKVQNLPVDDQGHMERKGTWLLLSGAMGSNRL